MRPRKKLVALQRATTVQDDYGEGTPTWGPLDGGSEPVTEKADVFYGRGDERRQAAMEQGEQAANFQMRLNSRTRTVRITDRIVLDGVNWDIQGISPDTPKRGSIEITATRSA